MNIICIHGMNQQHQTAQSLEKYWLSLLEQGLVATQHADFLPQLKNHFRMPFYGDLLSRHHLENIISASTLMPKKGWHLPCIHVLKAQTNNTKPKEQQLKIHSFSQITMNNEHNLSHELHTLTTLSKDYILRDFAMVMNYFPKLHGTLLHKFLVETYLYLSNPHFIRSVHTRIHEQLHTSKPNILIAHSLGSVIAYHYLLLHPELHISCFITLGSPLAFRTIYNHLPQPLQRPISLSGDWINFYSKDDFLSAIPLQNSPFNFNPAIINHQIQTSIDHPHDIGGYLKHPSVIDTILNTFKKSA